MDSEDIDDSIEFSDDCLVDGLNANENVDGAATEDDLNNETSDLESDITHNSLSYNEDLQASNNYNNNQHQQQQRQRQQQPKRLQYICKKQPKQLKQQQQQQQQLQKAKHQHCHSSDIDEKETINVSSHQPHHLQSARDCIQTKVT